MRTWGGPTAASTTCLPPRCRRWRIAELEGERRAITDSVKAFYEANREFENAPALRFEARRREARLDQVDEVLTGVRRDFENARTEEVNDTPLLTVMQRPTMPERR